MIYAVVDGDMVVNTVVADPQYAEQQGWIAAHRDVCIGWSYIDGEFVDNRPKPEIGE